MTSPRPVDKRLESGRKSCVVREFLRGFGDQKISGDSLSTGGGSSQIFLIFRPDPWGRFSPIFTSIFFKWVGEKPPTSCIYFSP